jgi:radical SAM protein with 4Fe4S-binding SPASM domain
MGDVMQGIWDRALTDGIPLSVHFDLTYRCNERCVHCYLDHDDHGEMTTAEVRAVLDQLAAAGTLFLIFSGGELLLRKDFFELLAYARQLGFDVKIKTNGILINERAAARIRELGVRSVQISIYSHLPDVHDAITKVPGSLERSLRAIRSLTAQGLRVTIANVLMRQNAGHYPAVRALAADLGVDCTIDPTITPKMDGDRSIVGLRVTTPQLLRVFRDKSLIADSACEPPATDDDLLDARPCSAGHTACYISPYGDVYPCVQFPLPTGNVRQQRFDAIWQHSPQLEEVRGIRMRDLATCSACSHMETCSRCPGLAYMEGNMRGPSSADCEKSQIRAIAAGGGTIDREGACA